MVMIVYSCILIPLAIYLVMIAREAMAAFIALASPKKPLIIHPSWEIAHTLLVYSFTVFMITYVSFLVEHGVMMIAPFLLLSVGFVARGLVYLHMHNSSGSSRESGFFWRIIFAGGHIVGTVAVAQLLWTITHKILQTHIVPSVDDVGVLLLGLCIALAVGCAPFLVRK